MSAWPGATPTGCWVPGRGRLSRLARPASHAWAGPGPMRLHEVAVDKGDHVPRALTCHAPPRAGTGGMMLRFESGRPVRQVTEDFPGWACWRLAAEAKRALLLVWDSAFWNISGRDRARTRAHDRRVKSEGVCGSSLARCR